MSFTGSYLGRLRAWTPLLLFAVLLQPLEPVPAAQEKKPSQEQPQKKPQKKPPIPRLAAEKLPKQTRTRPDPAKSQVELETIHVDIEELAQTMDGTRYTPGTRVVQNYLEEYLRRAGYRVLKDAAGARYRIHGKISTIFDTELILQKRIIAWKYAGNVVVDLLDAEGKNLQKVSIPEVFRLNVKNEKSAIWDLRRYLSHLIYSEICLGGKVLGNKEIFGLIESLAVDSFDREEDVEAGGVVEKLADHGLSAVPYLLHALTDTRPVMANAEYPDLKVPTDLKIYHLADKALEEIFQKVSRLELKTPARLRFYIIAGWENEWRRFCKPFRESPEPERRRHALLKKSEGAVQEKNLRILDFSRYGTKPSGEKGGEKAGAKTGAKKGSDKKGAGAEPGGKKQP